MTRYISVADTAKLVRAALKAAHPGVKFSVRSHSYAGGASINVSWTDGPATHAVDEVVKPFAGASFDGMVDLKSYHTSELGGEQVHFQADFVFTNRETSPAEEERLMALLVAGMREEASEHKYYEGICVDGCDRVLSGYLSGMVRQLAEAGL